MNRHSLRLQLPLSYVATALLTSLALGATVLFGLQLHFGRQERDYLRQSARLVADTLAPLLAADAAGDVLEERTTRLAELSGSRIRVLDAERRPLAEADGSRSGRTWLLPDAPLAPPSPSPPTPLGLDRPTLQLEPAPPRLPPLYDPAAAEPRWLAWLFRPQRQEALQPIVGAPGIEPLGFVVLASERSFVGILAGVARVWGLASLGVLLAAAGFGLLWSRRLGRPLLALREATRAMATGDLSARAEVVRDDEIGALARSFNRMAQRIEGHVEVLRRFTADAAHALHTPLTALRSNLELGATEADAERRRDFLAGAEEQTGRLQELVANLLALARLDASETREAFVPLDLVALLRREVESYASQAEGRGIALELSLPDAPVVVHGRPGELRGVVGVLLDNALKFTPAGGRLWLTAERHGSEVVVRVRDTGIGIPAADLPTLFERFRRGRNAAPYPGSGLGLAIARAVVERHGGTIAAEAVPSGASFRLSLPRLEPAPPRT